VKTNLLLEFRNLENQNMWLWEKINNFPTLIYNHLTNDGEKIQSCNIVVVVDFFGNFQKITFMTTSSFMKFFFSLIFLK
jgi:hypothetical protein